MIRAVIFDLDGTLVDAFAGHLWAYDEAAKKLNMPKMTRKVFSKYYGQSGTEIIRQFLKKPFVDKTVEELARVKREFFSSGGSTFVVALPSVVDFISELEKRKIPMAVASSARKVEIEMMLQKIGVRNKIQEIVSADDIKNSKPHPEIFLKAAEKLNVAPKDCVVFEDSPWGVMAAKAAGMKCIAVATGTTSKKDLKKLAPDIVLGSLEELLPPKLDKILISL
ncbi:Glyceraldehyde 3-phosphate phosphatase [uncultured archaeon]|nr:Glyceraldehyde 3-phosphate phosphatase [uncultured archaeon]